MISPRPRGAPRLQRLGSLLLLAASAGLGCERKPDEPVAPRAADEPAGAAPSADGATGAARVIADLRREKLPLVPRARAAQRIVLRRGKLAHLTQDALVIRDVVGSKEQLRLPVSGPRLLTVLRDDSLLALLERESLRVEPRKYEVTRLSRVPLFPQSQLVPDPLRERRFYVVHAFDPTLYGYEISDDGKLTTLDFVELDGFDGRAFVMLKDGSFLHTTKQGLRRFFLGGKTQTFALEGEADVWRIMSAKRLSRLWLARSSGHFELCEIVGSALRVVARLPATEPVDSVSAGAGLAWLGVQSAGAGRHFSLELLDEAGASRALGTYPLAEASGGGESWVSEVLEDRGIAASDDGALIAVGGPSLLEVWNAKTGERLLRAPP